MNKNRVKNENEWKKKGLLLLEERVRVNVINYVDSYSSFFFLQEKMSILSTVHVDKHVIQLKVVQFLLDLQS